jgi:hypothetical protein
MTAQVSPLWRFVVTTLGGAALTYLDHLASDKQITPKLGEALEVTLTVPSDNSQVNTLHTDGFPFVAEGVRQLIGFRQGLSGAYSCKAACLIMQVSDASGTGDARTTVTAWDPWRYLFSVPVFQSSAATVGKDGPAGTNGALIDKDNIYYPSSMGANEVIFDILVTTIAFMSGTAPNAAQALFLDITSGTIETCPAPAYGSATPEGQWEIQQGTSVGQALQDIGASGACDIVLSPIYDTVRPGILCELNIYAEGLGGNGAGTYRPGAFFSWDMPGRSLVGVENLYDGTERANHIQYYYGQGGPPATSQIDSSSIAVYGEYWAQQFWPGNKIKPAVEVIAANQLSLRSTYKETLTVHPAPERSPEPFVDYYIGDRVPVYVSDNMRQQLPPAGDIDRVWQRVYGIPVQIDDNGVETVTELLVGPVGPAPPVTLAGVNQGLNSQTSIPTRASIPQRGGSVQAVRGG